MRRKSAAASKLDQAYADGRLVAFRRMATRAGCPYIEHERDLRVAWLDGFQHGLWDARVATNTGEPGGNAVNLDAGWSARTDDAIGRQTRNGSRKMAGQLGRSNPQT